MMKNRFLKLFLILMSALILNQCIDEIDFQPLLSYNQIGNFNDLNSAVEYISEIVLGHKDVFPEFTKDGRHKQSSCFKHITVKNFTPFALNHTQDIFYIKAIFSIPPSDKYHYLFYKEINQPPNA